MEGKNQSHSQNSTPTLDGQQEKQHLQIAIVTGASSGIGKAISQMLLNHNYEVYGIGRKFDTLHQSKEKFHPIVCDVLNTPLLLTEIKKITDKHKNITMLVNNAGCAYYGLHEELNTAKIQQMVRTNLEVPMILSQLLLRILKENHGIIINISSVTATKSSPHGCAYAATKAGLSSFGKSLFDEARKYGIRVLTIQPDMTSTQLYRNADFKESDDEEARLLPEDIANAVENVLTCRNGINVSELTLQPQKHKIQKK